MVYIGLEHAFVWAVFTMSIVTPVLGILELAEPWLSMVQLVQL